MDKLKPSQIVNELDKYIIGQNKAKRSVAVTLRNRWRRQQVNSDFKDEISPKNIILIGPTGVGKTEISRRLSNLTGSPFSKVDASKFTEVGYVGRDVESMIRDLVSITIGKIRSFQQKTVKSKARIIAENKILDLLIPKSDRINDKSSDDYSKISEIPSKNYTTDNNTREKFYQMLRSGKLDNRYVEIDSSDNNSHVIEVLSGPGIEDITNNLKEMLGSFAPKSKKKQKIKIKEAIEKLTNEESKNLVNMNKVIKLSIEKVEQSGIIFLDEIDKVISSNKGNGPDVSREGVQRDLLPIVEGTTVSTKYGSVRTDNILFIASGAFHTVKPSDLIPELQGRFPIRVELDALKSNDFYRILIEPKNALLFQYIALLKTEGINLVFEDKAVKKISELAEFINSNTDNIGARRLHTLMEYLLEEILFEAPELLVKKFYIDKEYVENKLKYIKINEDLSKYIL